MSMARLRRLQADWQKVQAEFTGHPYITVEPIGPANPPDRYRVTYRVKGLWRDAQGNIRVRDVHRAEIYLHTDYPREKPKCVMLDPVWHPNFGSYICIGDHWAAGETLVDVIYQIGEMLTYQEYNPKSPLNAEAARWSELNRNRFPLQNIPLRQPDIEITLHPVGESAQENSSASTTDGEPDDELKIELN